MDGEHVKQVVDYFMDVVVDTHAVRERVTRAPDSLIRTEFNPICAQT